MPVAKTFMLGANIFKLTFHLVQHMPGAKPGIEFHYRLALSSITASNIFCVSIFGIIKLLIKAQSDWRESSSFDIL